jgi:sugar O-acyltransferase (sialic acid O-acetyltransferase NeuD family)
MTNLIVFGAGKIAQAFHSFVSEDPELTIVAFTCDREFVTGPQFCGAPLVPFDEIESVYPAASHAMFVSIGYQELNAVRAERCRLAREKGYRLISWVSPRANVPKSCAIGENCIVMEGASLQPYAMLGDDVFVWNGAVIGHHAKIGNHCWIASNATISSSAVIEPNCFFGVNAAVGHNVTIGARSLIGASAVITRCTAPEGVYIAPETERYRLNSRSFMRIAKMS